MFTDGCCLSINAACSSWGLSTVPDKHSKPCFSNEFTRPISSSPKISYWLGVLVPPRTAQWTLGNILIWRLTERFSRQSNITSSIRNGLRSPFKKPELKLFTDLFLWELSGRKEPSQTCSQERDYQKDENNMKQQQISHEYHSSRLTTFVSYLRKSGFKQNNYWKRICFNDHNHDHRHIKNLFH